MKDRHRTFDILLTDLVGLEKPDVKRQVQITHKMNEVIQRKFFSASGELLDFSTFKYHVTASTIQFRYGQSRSVVNRWPKRQTRALRFVTIDAAHLLRNGASEARKCHGRSRRG